MRFTRVTIIRTQEPRTQNINELLQWFGGTLGLFNLRDKDRSCFRIFIVLLNNLKQNISGISSDDIANKTGLSRGTVIHHLNRLMETGIVDVDHNRYFLKVDSLEELVEVVRGDVNKAFDSLADIGKDIDNILGLK